MNRLTAGILILIGVFVTAEIAQSQMALGEEITLGVGESRTLDSGFRIGFDGILSDSRCPEDALCFWEGDAAAQLWADQPPGDKFVFQLHTYGGFQWQAVFGGYLITLVDVKPYPRIGGEIDPKEYIVTLVVADIFKSVESTSWGRIKQLLN